MSLEKPFKRKASATLPSLSAHAKASVYRKYYGVIFGGRITEVNESISDNKNSKVSALDTLEGEDLMIPDVFDEFKSGVTSRISMGLTNIAFCISDSQSPHTLKHQIRNLYEGLDINNDIFISLHQAKNWLYSLDVKIEQDQVSKLFR